MTYHYTVVGSTVRWLMALVAWGSCTTEPGRHPGVDAASSDGGPAVNAAYCMKRPSADFSESNSFRFCPIDQGEGDVATTQSLEQTIKLTFEPKPVSLAGDALNLEGDSGGYGALHADIVDSCNASMSMTIELLVTSNDQAPAQGSSHTIAAIEGGVAVYTDALGEVVVGAGAELISTGIALDVGSFTYIGLQLEGSSGRLVVVSPNGIADRGFETPLSPSADSLPQQSALYVGRAIDGGETWSGKLFYIGFYCAALSDSLVSRGIFLLH